MKLSVVIPCYNERPTIETVVEAVRSGPVKEVEIIIVDDGSTDGTKELLEKKPPGWVDKVVLQQRNLGKGAALRAGFRAATGDLVVVQDADLEYDPKEYPLLISPILEDRADVVFGSRFMRRPASSGGLLLAYGGKPISDAALEHVYKLEPHRYGELLQSFSTRTSGPYYDRRRPLWS